MVDTEHSVYDERKWKGGLDDDSGDGGYGCGVSGLSHIVKSLTTTEFTAIDSHIANDWYRWKGSLLDNKSWFVSFVES